MACLKCGRETTSNANFCDDCIAGMKNYPIHPDTRVVLPKRTPVPVQRKPVRKKTISPEEQITALKSRVRLLFILLTAVSILAALLMYPAIQYLLEDHFLPGQNYTSIVSVTSETEGQTIP